MSKYDQHYQIRQRERSDTARADQWIAAQGLDAESFQGTNVRLLRAQRQAHTLLSQHSDLLTQSQRRTLEDFKKKMAGKKTRSRLNPSAANAVLNIGSKINRQLFKQHRHLIMASNTSN
jgi:hypothetical protein